MFGKHFCSKEENFLMNYQMILKVEIPSANFRQKFSVKFKAPTASFLNDFISEALYRIIYKESLVFPWPQKSDEERKLVFITFQRTTR